MVGEYSTEEINEYVRMYEKEKEETGIKKAEFALREGINLKNLCRWISYRKTKAKRLEKKNHEFVQVKEKGKSSISFSLNGNLIEFKDIESLQVFISLMLDNKGGSNTVKLCQLQ